MATLDVINLEKQKVGTVDLPDEIVNAPIEEHLWYEVVKAQLASRRAGTVGVKNRSLVSGGGKKPYKQKGTGRARQGSIRASQWVGGGKAMAPKMRDYEYHVPKKVRKAAIRAAISKRNADKALVVVDSWIPQKPSTKSAVSTFEERTSTSYPWGRNIWSRKCRAISSASSRAGQPSRTALGGAPAPWATAAGETSGRTEARSARRSRRARSTNSRVSASNSPRSRSRRARIRAGSSTSW